MIYSSFSEVDYGRFNYRVSYPIKKQDNEKMLYKIFDSLHYKVMPERSNLKISLVLLHFLPNQNNTPGDFLLLQRVKKQVREDVRRYKTVPPSLCLLKFHLFIPDIQNNVSLFCVKNSSGFCSAQSDLAIGGVEASSMYNVQSLRALRSG